VPGLTFTSPTVPTSAVGLRAEVRAFIRDQLASDEFSPRCDSWLAGHSPAFSRALGERGWVGMTLPRQYGGAERTAVERFVVIAELLAAGAPVAAHWFADRQIGPQLLKYGT
jgi:acyl-CoA dehydrogenase